VTGVLDDVVWRVDADSGQVTDTISVGRAPAGIAVTGDGVWVTAMVDGTVTRLDPETRKVVQTIEVGGRPRGVAVADGSVWVVSRAT
jgi:YVTN family beta-propeller protein